MIKRQDSCLEGVFHKNTSDSSAPAVLILHPHPLHGGTMNNNVVYRLFHACVEANCSVLRFNFRGVGHSSGEFDNGIGELKDAGIALDWLQNNTDEASTYLVMGFSFGGAIALQLLVRRPEIEGFVVLAPYIDPEQSNISPCPTSGMIIQGSEDTLVKESDSYKLWQKLNKQKSSKISYNVIEGADHMFKGHLDKVSSAAQNYLIENARYGHKAVTTKKDRRTGKI